MKLKKLVYLLSPVCLLASHHAEAIDISGENYQGSIDTTISYGVAMRVTDRDPRLIGIANGGSAYSVNGDDGNLNYQDQSLISNTIKITSEMELDWGSFGAFVRGSAFYDFENQDGHRERTQLSEAAKELVGADIDLLDAYVWKKWDLNGKPLDVRLGKQLLSWGESTFIQNSINTINPVDVSKLRVPGAELKEALLPVPMISASLAPTDNSSVDVFYQLKWQKTEGDPVGSYWSSNDFVGAGGSRVMLNFGQTADTVPASSGAVVSAAPVNEAKDSGQYGVAFRYLAESLNNTEFGAYFINYHSRLPLIGAISGTQQAAAGLDPTQGYVQSARYTVTYPEDIQLYGLSFNTLLPTSGIALQGEFSWRHDVPLQVDDVEVLYAALGAASNLSPGSQASPSLAAASAFAAHGQYGLVPFSTFIPGYIRRDVTQAQVTATKVFGPGLGASATTLVGEVGVTNVIDMPDKNVLRLEGPGTFRGGNPALAGNIGYEADQHFADRSSWGYRVLMRMQYDNALAGINLTPSIAFQHDVNGVSPGPAGNFIEGRKAFSLGLGGNYMNTWSADLNYTRFSGAGAYNLINDRDFVAANIKYSF